MSLSRITSEPPPVFTFNRSPFGSRPAQVIEAVRKAKAARDCTRDEIAAMREGNRRHDDLSVFDAGMAEAKRLGTEAQQLGKPITSDPYDRDLFPLHSEAWCDAWQDEAQRRLTGTDC